MFETTALGAAILAGVGAGVIDMNSIDASQITKFTPQITENGKLSYKIMFIKIFVKIWF